ncbi:MAG: zinc transport system permease protein [Rhodospirillaceae bacterium]|nr:MAG: zinc transport system permease protein [Rhodospirillaceae bacterium]
MDDFLLRALLAGSGIALAAGPLGVFVVWRRMAYFGDAVAHSALLGVALALLMDLDVTLGVVGVCLGLAGVLLMLQRQRHLADDTRLGLLAHGTLAAGMVVLSFLDRVRFDLIGYLFGDILAVSSLDLIWIYGGGVVTLAILAGVWRPLLAATVHEELAQVEGQPVVFVQAVYVFLLAFYIAIAMKVVGMLLVTALLVVPPAVARRFARTPESMAGFAAAIGTVAVAGGLGLSLATDTPSGPTVVVVALSLFGLSLLTNPRQKSDINR